MADLESMFHLPHKTIERLSQYRRALLLRLEEGKTHIFSHEIARIQHITPVQVRRDLMLIGYSGSLRKGYNIQELIDLIGDIIDSHQGINVAVVGMGNLGRALINYFKGKRHKLSIIAGFDNNPDKIGRKFSGTLCYDVKRLDPVIHELNIQIGIITVPGNFTTEIAQKLVKAGVKGIVNYTPTPIQVPKGVRLEEYDMITTLEKVAFFVKVHSADTEEPTSQAKQS